MKTRVGFVSNSSSSSFVLYGCTMQLNEAVEKIVDTFPEILIGRSLPDGTYETPNEIVNYLKELGIEIDYYTSEEGEVRIGVMANPECLSVEQLRNGVFTEEQMEKVDKLFKELGIDPYSEGGEWYY